MMDKDEQNGRLDVLSCGVDFPKDACALELIAGADVVFGSQALLAACPVDLRDARRDVWRDARCIGAQARENAAEALALCRAGRRVVVLASGDALYHGFGGTLSGMAQSGDNLVFHPGITAFQALFHRLGLPWEDAALFSVHASDLPLRAIAEAPLAVVYAGTRTPAHAVARAVIDFHPAAAERRAVLAERLGTADERLLSGTLAELASADCGPTSILVLFPETANGPAPVLALGLPESDFERENNLITASDVRAVILSRLRLPAWGVLWDIGAGSGSVGLEAAALRPRLRVFGVERKPERSAIIERNRQHLGVINYSLHLGEALSLIQGDALPAPDRIFIGGGGHDLPQLLHVCQQRLRPGGLVVASSVTLESFHALYAAPQRCGLCRLDIAQEAPLAGTHRHLKPQNTIHLFSFQKEA